jgi:Flp pilus assembly pilin Flp
MNVGDDEGATSTEYALLIAMVVFILVGALTIFGDSVTALYEDLADAVGGFLDSFS